MVSTNTSGPLDDSGNTNPDDNFRYDAWLFGRKVGGGREAVLFVHGGAAGCDS